MRCSQVSYLNAPSLAVGLVPRKSCVMREKERQGIHSRRVNTSARPNLAACCLSQVLRRGLKRGPTSHSSRITHHIPRTIASLPLST
jgi:hypothetical protein